MRNLWTALLCLTLSGFAVAQATGTTSQQHATTEKNAQAIQEPTAIFETTAGNITCTLFPDKAPLTVANFIGLATGTKDWKDPKTGKMMHGVPLYNGTIFHRVIPNFMIQGAIPRARDRAIRATASKMSSVPISPLTSPAGWRWPIADPERTARSFSSPKCLRLTSIITTPFSTMQDIEVIKKIARLATDPRNDRPNDPPKIIRIKITDPRHPAKTGTTHKSTGSGAQSTIPKSTPPSQQ